MVRFIIPSSQKLDELGFTEGEVVEVILSTTSIDGEYNAAPMGIWIKPGHRLMLRPYRDTQTAQNLAKIPEAVINITSDPRFFYLTAFKHELAEKIDLTFTQSEKVSSPRIGGMSGYIEVTVKESASTRENAFQTEYICEIQIISMLEESPQVHSRARCAAIECVIHATRIRALHKTDPEMAQALADQIKALHNIVTRIAPDSISAQIIQNVMQLLKNWVK